MSATFWNMRRRKAAQQAAKIVKQPVNDKVAELNDAIESPKKRTRKVKAGEADESDKA